MIKKIIPLCIFVSLNVFGASYPKSSGLDPRVQEIKYNPNNVTIVGVKNGVATLIQLEDDEFLSGDSTGMGIGDPLAWNVSVRGNNIFLRPIAEQPDTNISLVSNKRTYSILLQYKDKNPTYILRYVYEKPAKEPTFFNKKPLELPCSNSAFKGDYQVKGSPSLKPKAIWDDGQFTCFKWTNADDLPVVFRILPDGKEQLVNYHMQEGSGIMVVHEIANEFVLRLGDDVMNVRPDRKFIRPYNERGTTTNERLFKKEGVK